MDPDTFWPDYKECTVSSRTKREELLVIIIEMQIIPQTRQVDSAMQMGKEEEMGQGHTGILQQGGWFFFQ